MAAPKGTRPPAAGKGRVAGTPNKVTGNVKAMILGALSAGGGQQWLQTQMDKNPAAFMNLVGKVLPLQIAGDPKNPVRIEISIEDRRRAMQAIEDAFMEPITAKLIELEDEDGDRTLFPDGK